MNVSINDIKVIGQNAECFLPIIENYEENVLGHCICYKP